MNKKVQTAILIVLTLILIALVAWMNSAWTA